jgi:hypothetical protein
MGEIRKAYQIFVRNPKGTYDLGGLSVHGRIILKCTLKKWGHAVA